MIIVPNYFYTLAIVEFRLKDVSNQPFSSKSKSNSLKDHLEFLQKFKDNNKVNKLKFR